jgi:hypothetical protein
VSSSHKNRIRVIGDIRENRLLKIKIVMYTIMVLAVAASIYYLYTVNREIGIDTMLGRLHSLDYNYFTILILLIGIIVPVIVGIYIIAFYISQLKTRMTRLERELFFQVIEIKRLIGEIMGILQEIFEERGTQAENLDEQVSEVGTNNKGGDEDETLNSIRVEEDLDEKKDIKENGDNVELLRELLEGLKEMGRELERLRRKL